MELAEELASNWLRNCYEEGRLPDQMIQSSFQVDRKSRLAALAEGG